MVLADIPPRLEASCCGPRSLYGRFLEPVLAAQCLAQVPVFSFSLVFPMFSTVSNADVQNVTLSFPLLFNHLFCLTFSRFLTPLHSLVTSVCRSEQQNHAQTSNFDVLHPFLFLCSVFLAFFCFHEVLKSGNLSPGMEKNVLGILVPFWVFDGVTSGSALHKVRMVFRVLVFSTVCEHFPYSSQV